MNKTSKLIDLMESQIAVMKAYQEGKVIEWRHKNDNFFRSNSLKHVPIWDWEEYEYRVRVEPEVYVGIGTKILIKGDTYIIAAVADDMKVGLIDIDSGCRWGNPIEVSTHEYHALCMSLMKFSCFINTFRISGASITT